MSSKQSYSDIGEFVQNRTVRQLESQKKTILRTCIEEGHEAIARDDYLTLYIILKEGLKPLSPLDVETKRQYYKKAEERGLEFDWTNFTLFDQNPQNYDPRLKHWKNERVLLGAFQTYETVLALEHVVDIDAQQWIPIKELGHKVGERRVSATSKMGGEQSLLSEDDYETIDLIAGGTGTGKSTFLEILALQRYYNGEKVFDLHDTVEGENLLYDILSDDEELNQIRKDMGLPTSFKKKPDMEVLLPLSKNLSNAMATVDAKGDPVYKPFTIPASEISKDALLMLIDTTKAQRKYLSDAYEGLNGDWTLEDLADAVKDTGARKDVVDRIQLSIKSLQEKGYIRDKQDDNQLDWESLFKDTDTITSLTTMFMGSREESIVVTVYILNKIKEERERIKNQSKDKSDLPTLSLVIREMHNLAPSESVRGTDRLGDIQKYSVKKMKELSSYHRHLYMRVIGDAQLLGKQVDGSVRSMAHRIFQFSSQYKSVNQSFKSRVRVDSDTIQNVANYDQGVCALLDSDGYTMPLMVAPPACRHFDTQTDMNGWAVRAELTNERFVPVNVDTSLPERLMFSLDDEEDKDKMPPDEQFLRKGISEEKESFVYTPDLWKAFQTWATTTGQGMNVGKKRLMKTLREVYDLGDDDKSRRNYDGRHTEKDRAFGYWGIDFNEYGEDYHDEDA